MRAQQEQSWGQGKAGCEANVGVRCGTPTHSAQCIIMGLATCHSLDTGPGHACMQMQALQWLLPLMRTGLMLMVTPADSLSGALGRVL